MHKLWQDLAPFIGLFRRHWRCMALGTLFGVMTIAAAVGLLSLSGWFISATAFAGLTLTNAQLFNFFYPSIGVRFFAIIRTVSRYGERIATHDATFRILESLRSWLYKHLEPLAPACLIRYRSGEILNRIVADIEALDNLYLRVLSPSVVALFMSLAVIIFLWLFDPFIALTTFWFLLIAGVGVPVVAMRNGKITGQELARQSSHLRTQIVESIQGLTELLVFAAHHRHLDNIQQKSRELMTNQLVMSHIKGISTGLIIFFSGMAVLTIVYIGVGLVSHDDLDGANLALLGLAVLASFEAVWPLPLAYQYLGHTHEAGRRLKEIIDTEAAVVFPDHTASEPLRFDLKFDNVSFRYSEHAALAIDKADFEIPQGQRLAIIGETGSGKSTLVNLLVRFWNPTGGRILIGGEDIRALSETDLRTCIGVVSQHAHIFNMSFRENLLLAQPEAKEDDLYAALASAQLLDFVKSLPYGLDTWSGESGKLVSAGQARRLAVARLILKDAPIWVLDEPTEGLDVITEQQLLEALYGLMGGKTVLWITHRLVHLHRMDKIVILENGKIIGQGSHNVLFNSNSRYAALCKRIY
ncbi:MAG: cysteine/glutathione ABC transporter ATP-binding protein/permease CydC [Desulfobacterales bacterium]|nr:MAG: cysteine/glutathione ABC transporter ATP-binding protein/permease CydC [Desulfobacterales bacterium]